MLSLRSESQRSDFSPYQTHLQKAFQTSHGSEEAANHWRRDYLEGKSVAAMGGIVSLSGVNLSPIMEETVSSTSQGVAGDIHSPSTYEAQLFQMFADMEEMVEQQTLFDRERERLKHDRENTTRDWEEMKCLNDQLLAQITTLQNTRGPAPSSEKPTATKATSGEQSQS